MASVWRAQDQTLDRPVAIKFVFTGGRKRGDNLVGRFLREARIAAAVRHRNVVDILDFGTHEEGVPFMVMELLEGDTVEERLARGDRFTLEETLLIAGRVLQGLAAVHDAGIVHRDLKPGNILLARERGGLNPKLLDFGISRSLEPDSGPRSALTTKDGHLVGTPEYMSPEQARGLKDIDQRTDIYSMGVILYELLTGAPPFQSEHTGDLILQIMTETPLPVVDLRPEVGEAVSDLVAGAMERERELRFSDAEEMHRALMDVAQKTLGAGTAQLISLPPPTPGRGKADSRTRLVWQADQPAEEAAVVVQEGGGGGAVAPTMPEAGRTSSWDSLMPRKRSSKVPTAAVGAAVVIVGAAALGLALAWPESEKAKTVPRYIVVKGAGTLPASETAEPGPHARAEGSASEQSTARVAVAVAAPRPRRAASQPAGAEPTTSDARSAPPNTPSSGQTEPAPAVTAKGRQRLRETSKPETPEVKLARAFAQQKRGVESCFREHSSELAQASRLSVRLSLAKDGGVREAQVLPKDVAQSSIGACIVRAAKAMKFGRQKAPISFRIPLTARVGKR